MGRVRKKKPLVEPPMKSRKRARRVTSAYHRVTAALAAEAAGAGPGAGPVAQATRQALERELEALGGVQAYQQASQLNTAVHSTSKWVKRTLQERQLGRGAGRRVRVLEVGAVNTQLLAEKGWLEVRAIDLHSSDPRIEELDFFELVPEGAFQVAVCSMVLNCVPEPARRGRMLANLRGHLGAAPGLCFLTIPKTCLAHSWYLDKAAFQEALAAVGLPVVKQHDTEKICFFLSEAAAPCAEAGARFRARKGKRKGKGGKKSRGALFDVEL